MWSKTIRFGISPGTGEALPESLSSPLGEGPPRMIIAKDKRRCVITPCVAPDFSGADN